MGSGGNCRRDSRRYRARRRRDRHCTARIAVVRVVAPSTAWPARTALHAPRCPPSLRGPCQFCTARRCSCPTLVGPAPSAHRAGDGRVHCGDAYRAERMLNIARPVSVIFAAAAFVATVAGLLGGLTPLTRALDQASFAIGRRSEEPTSEPQSP